MPWTIVVCSVGTVESSGSTELGATNIIPWRETDVGWRNWAKSLFSRLLCPLPCPWQLWTLNTSIRPTWVVYCRGSRTFSATETQLELLGCSWKFLFLRNRKRKKVDFFFKYFTPFINNCKSRTLVGPAQEVFNFFCEYHLVPIYVRWGNFLISAFLLYGNFPESMELWHSQSVYVARLDGVVYDL